MAIQLYLQSRMQFPRELVEKNLVKFIRVGGETCSHRSGGFNTPVLAPGKPEPQNQGEGRCQMKEESGYIHSVHNVSNLIYHFVSSEGKSGSESVIRQYVKNQGKEKEYKQLYLNFPTREAPLQQDTVMALPRGGSFRTEFLLRISMVCQLAGWYVLDDRSVLFLMLSMSHRLISLVRFWYVFWKKQLIPDII